MNPTDPHTAWPEEYAAAMKRWQDCGHRCGCDELCSTGEDKAERMKDDRGATDARNLLAVVGFAVVLGMQVLALAHPVIALWSLGLIALWVALAIPLAFVVARRIGGAR